MLTEAAGECIVSPSHAEPISGKQSLFITSFILARVIFILRVQLQIMCWQLQVWQSYIEKQIL